MPGIPERTGTPFLIYCITYFLCSLVPSAVKLHLVSESSIISPFSKEHLHSGASSLKNLASYRMASLTGANGRTVFKILTITAILVPLVSLISTLSIISTFGVGKTSQASWAGIINAVISKAEGGNTPMAPPWAPYAILGLWS